MEIEEIAELTPLAASLATLHELTGRQDPYQVQVLVKLRGAVDTERLAGAVRRAIERHELLRASIRRDKNGRSLFVIEKEVTIPLETTWCSPSNLHDVVREEADSPIFIRQAPMVRVHLFRPDARQALLSLTIHHSIIDGTSVSILLDDLFNAYDDPRIQYSRIPRYTDFLASYNSFTSSEHIKPWRDELDCIVEPSLLFGHTSSPIYATKRFATPVDAAELDRAEIWARKRDLPLRAVVDTAWGMVLSSLLQTDNVVFGTVVSTRRPEMDGHDSMVGPYINTIPRIVCLQPTQTAADSVADVEARRLRTLSHEDVSLAEIQGQRGLGTLFDTAVAFENYVQLPHSRALADGVEVGGMEVHDGTDFPLSLVVIPSVGAHLLIDDRQVPHELATSISSLFSSALRDLLCEEDTGLANRRSRTLAASQIPFDLTEQVQSPLQGFWKWVVKTPESPALTDALRTLTYEEARRLQQGMILALRSAGVRPGDTVAIAAQRTVELPLAMLAIAEAGATTVVVDLEAPQVRNSLILDRTRPAAAFVDRNGADTLYNLVPEVVQIDFSSVAPAHSVNFSAPALENLGDNGFSVIFTSGSTGTPKGVLLTHAKVARTFEGLANANHIDVDSRWLSVSALSFDLAFCELLIPLTVGAHCHVGVPNIGKDVDTVRELLQTWNPTFMSATPLLWRALLQEEVLGDSSLQAAMTVGEAPAPEVVSGLRHALSRVTNGYGPTEASICVSVGHLDEDTRIVGTVNYGYDAYILDSWLRPMPPGVVGELYVAGNVLAAGYLSDAPRTSANFVANPFGGPGARMYRTGDLASMTRLGVLSLAGRSDNQVKIRGHRVELGELEQAFRTCGADDVGCVAIQQPDGGLVLAAGIVDHDRRSLQDWRLALADVVPTYMLPSAVVPMQALPRNASGKIDRTSIARSATRQLARSPHPEDDHEADELVRVLVEQFAAVLGRVSVHSSDDFFSLGGHSLTAAQLTSRVRKTLNVDLPANAVFASPTPRALANRVRNSPELTSRPEAHGATSSSLSGSQMMVWLAESMTTGRSAYGGGLEIRVPTPVDEKALQYALARLRDRHRILRTTIHETADIVKQAETDPNDLSAIRVPKQIDAAQSLSNQITEAFKKITARPFDLRSEAPIRVALGPWEGDYQRLLVVTHHIAVDGYSMPILLNDLMGFYSNQEDNSSETASLLQYTDYVAWMSSTAQRQKRDSDLAWWLEQISAETPLTQLPFLPESAVNAGGPAEYVKAHISPSLHRDLEQLATEHKTTLNVVLQAGLAYTLSSLGNNQTVTLGVALDGRSDEEFNRTIGMFVNTAVLYSSPVQSRTVSDLLQNMHDAIVSIQEHSLAPFHLVASQARLRRQDPSAPLFNIYSTYSTHTDIPSWMPYTIGESYSNGEAKFDLSVDFLDYRSQRGELGGVDITLEFPISRITSQTVQDISDCLLQVYTKLGDTTVQELPNPLTEEMRNTLATWSEGRRDASARRRPLGSDTIWESLSRHAKSVAVVDAESGQSLTYEQLESLAASIRRSLSSSGVREGDHVAIFVDSGYEALPNILAIWSLGAIYTPIDTSVSPGTLAELLTRLGASSVLVGERYQDTAAVAVSKVEDCTMTVYKRGESLSPVTLDLPVPVSGMDPAYTLFTSGSTGKPKGATVHWSGMVNHLQAKIDLLNLGPTDVVVQNAPLTFDVSIWQLVAPLLVGGQVVAVHSGMEADPIRLLSCVNQYHVTTLEMVPSLLRASIDIALGERSSWTATTLRTLMVTGEAFPSDLAYKVQAAGAEIDIVNAYGPTECSDDVTHYLIHSSSNLTTATVPIGRPIQGAQLHVLGEEMQLLPPGWIGELYVEGDCLGLGYHGDGPRTAAAFVANPFQPGKRLYRTGDMVRWSNDGNLIYQGRADQQVKIRGQRLEIGAVEASIRALGVVSDVAVVTRPVNETQVELVAFVVSSAERHDLHAIFAKDLPSSHIPAQIFVVDSLPKNSAGKIDRPDLQHRALSVADSRSSAGELSPQLKRAMDTFAAILGHQVGPDDDFFLQGGDSIKAIQLATRLRELGMEVSPAHILGSPTPRALVNDVLRIANEPLTLSSARFGRFSMPPKMRATPGSVLGSPAFSMHTVLELPAEVSGDDVQEGLNALVRRHETLSMEILEHGQLRTRHESERPSHCPMAHVVVDLACGGVLGALVEDLREELDPTAGQMIRTAFVVDEHAPDRRLLVLVVHHAAIDAASWYVLLSDLIASVSGNEGVLAQADLTYRQWAEQLEGYAGRAMAEEPHWADQNSGASLLYPVGHAIAAKRVRQESAEVEADVAVGITVLAEHLTVQPADVVLAGIFEAIYRIRSAIGLEASSLSVGLEMTGREGSELSAPADSVGWYSGLYPVHGVPGLGTSTERILSFASQANHARSHAPSAGHAYGIVAQRSERRLAELLTPPNTVVNIYGSAPVDQSLAGWQLHPLTDVVTSISDVPLEIAVTLPASRTEHLILTWIAGETVAAHPALDALSFTLLEVFQDVLTTAQLGSGTFKSVSAIDNSPISDSAFVPLVELKAGDGTPLFCVHGGVGLALPYLTLTRYAAEDTPVYGIQAFNVPPQVDSIASLADHYVSIVTSIAPKGSVKLIGWSFGGFVAFEMGCRLQKMGRQVQWLGVIDQFPDARAEPLPERPVMLGELLNLIGYDTDDLQLAAALSSGSITAVLDCVDSGVLKDVSEENVERILESMERHQRLIETFSPGSFQGDLHLIKAAQSHSPDTKTSEQWSPFVVGQVLEYIIDAEHDHILEAHAQYGTELFSTMEAREKA